MSYNKYYETTEKVNKLLKALKKDEAAQVMAEYYHSLRPDSDIKVLKFIFNFGYSVANDLKEYEKIRMLFRAGYCYYFAVMLKEAFQRGTICWMDPYGHIAWQDDNGIFYDIEGFCDCCDDGAIPRPINTLDNDFLKDYKHVD